MERRRGGTDSRVHPGVLRRGRAGVRGPLWKDYSSSSEARDASDLGRKSSWWSGYAIDVAMTDSSVEYAQSVMSSVGRSADGIAYTVDYTGSVITTRIGPDARARNVTPATLVAWAIAHELGHHAIGGGGGIIDALTGEGHPHNEGFIDAVRGPRRNQRNPVFSDEGGREFITGLNISLR